MDVARQTVVFRTSKRQLVVGAAALLALLIFAAWLRLAHFDESLWLDELHTSWAVHDSLSDVAPRAAMGNQPPLPYWLWWAWVQVAGESEFTLRFPSLVASLAAIAILYFVVLRWTGSQLAGWTAAALLACEPISLFYGGEARVYAWLQALGLLYFAVLVQLMKQPTRAWRIAWVVLGIILIYTHYTAALFVGSALTVALSYALVRRTNSKYRVRSILIDVTITLLALTPAIPNLRMIIARRHNWAQFVELPSLDTLHELVGYPQTLGLAMLAVVASWGLAKLHRRRPINDAAQPEQPALSPRWVLLAIVVWNGLPLVIAALLTQLDVARLFFPRYLVMATVATPAVIGVLVGEIRSLRGRSAATLLLVFAGLVEVGLITVLLTSPNPRQTFVPARRENWRDAIAAINRRLADGRHRTIILLPGLIEARSEPLSHDTELQSFAAFPLHALYEVDDSNAIILPVASADEIFSTARKDEAQRGTDSALVIARCASEWDVFDELYAEDKQHRHHYLWYKTERTRVDGITVFVLWLAPP